MTKSMNGKSFSQKLVAEFTKISSNETIIQSALYFLEQWLNDELYSKYKQAVLAHVEANRFALLLDSFYQMLPFGTGGRRGRVGFGPNRINEVTVSLSVQGHCNYLKAAFPTLQSPSVVVAYDTRIFTDISQTYDFLGNENPLLNLTSYALSEDACEIYAGNGFAVNRPRPEPSLEYLSTPELSFAIRKLKALGGINVSASHNHPDDNGFKFYNAAGAQDIPPKDQELASFMDGVEKINKIPLDQATAAGKLSVLDSSVHDAYLATNLQLKTKPRTRSLSVVYTPLSGTGDSTVGDVLRHAGYDVHLFKPQANHDGTFATIPFRLPNPEVPEAAQPALNFAREKGASLVLSTDPDADRLGLYALSSTGEWRYLSGNDIAAILAYYLTIDQKGPRKSGLIIKTLVTTRVLVEIARQSGCRIIPDLLVGFKYIANVLESLETTGRFNGVTATPQELILAAEESHGVLLTPEIRDKDAAGGALLICELVEQLESLNTCLPDYLNDLLLRCGNFANATRSIVMRGIEGANRLQKMMTSLREDPVGRVSDLAVLEVVDYLSEDFGPIKSATDALSRNLLLWRIDGGQIVIRPSGTEPKVKIYADIEGQKLTSGNDHKAAQFFAQSLADRVFEICLDRIGVTLSPSASTLPDHVDLDLRLDFDSHFRRELLANAKELAQHDPSETIEWLRSRLSQYGAGADPLESTGKALLQLCTELRSSNPEPDVKEALKNLESTLSTMLRRF